MADIVVLDTHALLWCASDPARLGKKARVATEGAERVGIPAVVFWEVALLARKRRVVLGMPAHEWTDRVLGIGRVEEVPLIAAIAVRADGLAMHDNPADRFIAATALAHGPLATMGALLKKVSGLVTVW